MKKLKQLFISTKRGNEHYYIAKLSDDESSIIIQRVTRLANDERAYHTLISFIDCGEYIFSAIEIGDHKYSVASRTPSAEYEDNIPDRYAKYRDCCVEAITRQNGALRVHIDDYDESADVFNRFVITSLQGNTELTVAYVDVDYNNELGVTLSGYPAGYEVSI